MATSLVRSRAAITGTKDRLTWDEVKDGAVFSIEEKQLADCRK